MNRIAFLVTRSDQIGGSHIHVRDLAFALQKDGFTVSVFMGGPGPVVDHFKRFGLNVVEINSLKRNISPIQDFKAYAGLKKEISDFRPDIIATHSSKAGYLGRIVGWKLGIPVTFTAHGWAFTDGKSSLKQTIYRFLEKTVVPMTSKFIAVSEYDRQLGLDYLSLSEKQIVTIYNGMTDIEPELMAKPEQKEPINIVMVARFDQQKDQAELLKAVHPIENIHVYFAGDGPSRKDVENLAKDLNIVENVTFLGEIDNVEELLSKGQIFALTSNWEGFPCSTLEAMRAGLPTVVSDVGGSSEAVDEGVTGYAVPKGDIDQLHSVIKDLVENHEKREKMGMAARKSFENNFTFDQMYKKTVATYKEVLNTKERHIGYPNR